MMDAFGLPDMGESQDIGHWALERSAFSGFLVSGTGFLVVAFRLILVCEISDQNQKTIDTEF